MSRGPGRIERAIMSALGGAEPSRTFTVVDLCAIAYPGEPPVRKRRISLIRALGNVITMPGYGAWQMERAAAPGAPFQIFRPTESAEEPPASSDTEFSILELAAK